MKGNVTIVIGGQFGSEAKGKVTSFLAKEFDIAVRTGSPNSGHTVFKNKKKIVLRHIPAGFVNPKCILCLGAGALINPDTLKKEIQLTKTKNRLFIDPQAGIIQKKHIKEEKEMIKTVGSTYQGCGAALVERIWRENFKLAKDVLKEYNITKITNVVNEGIDMGKNVIIEGTQGYGLSLYHGIYPFVTSRDTNASNFLTEIGISPRVIDEIILVIRTYPIRIAGNSGPLKNEISWEELSNRINKKITEKTSVTKKTRRVGEFDIDIVKEAIMINRPTQIALQFFNYLFPQDEGKNSWKSLSREGKDYIKKLEKDLKVPITLIGTGPQNDEMIDLRI